MRRCAALVAAAAAAATLAGALLACAPREDRATEIVRDGNRAFGAGAYGDAADAYTRALALEPDAPGVLVNRGNARAALGEDDAARADYDAALRVAPGFALAWANRGILRDRTGDRRGAVADYRRALELDPGLGRAPGILERVLHGTPGATIAQRLAYLEGVLGESGALPPRPPPAAEPRKASKP